MRMIWNGQTAQPTVAPSEARKTWQTLEPLHTVLYVSTEAAGGYADLGLNAGAGYFASRSAPLGPVSAEVVIATFYNFHPALVRSAIPHAWTVSTPEALIAARERAADATLRRILGTEAVESAEMAEAAALARQAAVAAGSDLPGRPLFAAHAVLDWPEAPHLALWHAQTLLREYRGDGHVAVLRAENVGPCEALVIDAATGQGAPEAVLRRSRAWPDDQWDASVETLRRRGWLDDEGALTTAGREHRQYVEDRTDALATGPYGSIGADGCARLRELCRPWSRQIMSSGAFSTVTS